MKPCYIWLPPLCWTPFSVPGCLYPGDEYGLYAVGSLPEVRTYWLFRMGLFNSIVFPLQTALGSVLNLSLYSAASPLPAWSVVRSGLVWGTQKRRAATTVNEENK